MQNSRIDRIGLQKPQGFSTNTCIAFKENYGFMFTYIKLITQFTSKRLVRTLDTFCDRKRTTTKQFLLLPSTFPCIHVRSIKLFSVKEAINVMSGGNINHSVSYNIFLSEAYDSISNVKPSCCSMLQPLFIYTKEKVPF